MKPSPSTLKRKVAVYRRAQEQAKHQRVALREMVIEALDSGWSVVDVADAVGWSRQSVYDLINESPRRRWREK